MRPLRRSWLEGCGPAGALSATPFLSWPHTLGGIHYRTPGLVSSRIRIAIEAELGRKDNFPERPWPSPPRPLPGLAEQVEVLRAWVPINWM